MRTLIDTSSLVALARYYHPFANMDSLNEHLQKEIDKGNIILLDKVQEESKYVSQGLAYNSFFCLQNKKMIVSTKDLIPPQRYYNMLENNFIDKSIKRMNFSDNEVGYQNEKDRFLQSADSALIVYAMKNGNELEPIRIMTEESRSQNDSKLFKKIPLICEELNIRTLTTVEYLRECETLTVVVQENKGK